jgi:transcriptional regulator of acetoin/glycerol metabolism
LDYNLVTMGDDGTASLREEAGPGRERPAHPSLVLVLNAASPFAPPIPISLAAIDAVGLGRGPCWRVVETGARRLRVDIADSAASATHAELERANARWSIVDTQSKNGTLVNGLRVGRAELGPEDLVEIGSSFFLLRPVVVLPEPSLPGLPTLNPQLAQELRLLARVARSRVPILFLGDSGTGKEISARAVHELSGRAGPFVPVNCGAIPDALVASELFGARRGAFSGAVADRAGMVVAAHGGTLFLDEIAELSEPSQAALLRVLASGEVMALGSSTPATVDCRIIAATNRNLAECVAEGRFRGDLYARLRGHVVTIPRLRARREDIGLLVATLLSRLGERARTVVLSRAAARALLSYPWPYNVRELEHAVTRALTILDGNEIRLEHLPAEVAEPTRAGGLDHVSDEREKLLRLLRGHGGNLSAVARALETSRSQLGRLLERYAIDVTQFRRKDDE